MYHIPQCFISEDVRNSLGIPVVRRILHTQRYLNRKIDVNKSDKATNGNKHVLMPTCCIKTMQSTHQNQKGKIIGITSKLKRRPDALERTRHLKQKLADYISIKYLEVAINRNSWELNEKNVTFDTEPPTLFYPFMGVKDVHNKCKRCISAEAFFSRLLPKKFNSTLKDVKVNNGDISKEMMEFCSNQIKFAEECKSHELHEFIQYVLETSREELNDDNPYKVGFVWLNRINKYKKTVESKSRKLEKKLKSMQSDPNFLLNDKTFISYQTQIQEAKVLTLNFQKRIEHFILCQQKVYCQHPESITFTDLRKHNEEVFIKRISNAIVMVEWLKSRLDEYNKLVSGDEIKMYTQKANEIVPKDWELMETHNFSNFPVKFCNTRRRPLNSVVVSLPTSLSHLYAFSAGHKIREMHPSWYRTLLNSSKVSAEITKIHRRNWELEKSIQVLENDIQRMEMERRMCIYMHNRLVELKKSKP